ncbi:hypothetical protein BK717_28745 [Bacillus thuringiensis serovar malayensis]|uniref:hypothetical protein n=1 Tax=Bacillus toyonensis TaxID=155322 RepID=UPI000B43EFC8|nr:hypothetical protein [Bacillus toyonensis]MEC2394211.1 hypothetical protein [Bacillus toyonensis]OTX28582.1 hypothetical protein BK717_28745 [Bacillus thuringiensis serovar malayensis]
MDSQKKKSRKFFMKLSCVIALSIVGGCSSFNISNKGSTVEISVDNDYSNSRFKAKELDDHTLVLIDKQTKVQYLKVVRNAGFDGGLDIVPLYQANGKPYVGEEVKDNRFSTQKLDKHTFIITDEETKVQYLKVVRNAGMDGGVVIEPLLNSEGGLLTTQ